MIISWPFTECEVITRLTHNQQQKLIRNAMFINVITNQYVIITWTSCSHSQNFTQSQDHLVALLKNLSELQGLFTLTEQICDNRMIILKPFTKAK